MNEEDSEHDCAMLEAEEEERERERERDRDRDRERDFIRNQCL